MASVPVRLVPRAVTTARGETERIVIGGQSADKRTEVAPRAEEASSMGSIRRSRVRSSGASMDSGARVAGSEASGDTPAAGRCQARMPGARF